MSEPVPPLLDVRNLTVRFRTDSGLLTAVNDVSYQIRPGETLGVVGESGSGKSVSSLAVMGLLSGGRTEISGSITARFRGEEPMELVGAPQDTVRRLRGAKVSMIFQEPMSSLNPVFRVGDQIAEAIEAHLHLGRHQAMERAIELLATVGIPEPRERARAYPHQLSGGMCQRVMIAMALSCEPQLLIADEPTTALDVTIQAQMLDLIRELQARFGMAVLFITHDMGVVAEMADHTVVMYGGRIVESGLTDTIIRRSQHPYTRGLIHSIPRIEGTPGRIRPIRGMMPDGRRLPPGCVFFPRCDHAVDGRCNVPEAARELLPAEPGHLARCVRLGEIWPVGSEVA